MSALNTFEEIYSENYKSMYRVALKIVCDKDAAFDIIQEVFIQLFYSLRDGRNISNPNRWLYKVTYLKCMDHFRKMKRLHEIKLAEDIEFEDEQYEKQELYAVMSHAISKLKPREKVLAILYSEGLSYNEMASVTGIKFSSIGKMLSRTLIKLEQELKRQRYEMY